MSKPDLIFIDFETQSNNDIRLGVNHYLACPNFRAYLLSYAIKNEKVLLSTIVTLTDDSESESYMYLSDKQKKLFNIIKSGNYLVVSHNTNFDVNVWNYIFPGLQIDWKKTLDTSWLCRVLNIPASLDKASQFFGQVELKDEAGKKILKKYYKVCEIPEKDLEIIINYNRQDVKALIELYYILTSVDYAQEGNRIIYDMVQAQNEIKIDVKKFAELKKLKDEILSKAEIKAKKLFPLYKKSGEKELVSIARSANEIKKFLKAEKNFTLPTISKNEIEEELNLIGVKLDKESETLISLYRVLQSKGLSKYDTFQEYLEVSKDTIRDFQISHGTHTGRPAGRGLQLHNVSRPPKAIENLTSEKVIKEIKAEIKKENFETAMKYLSALIWACMIPSNDKHVLARYDLSAIEPRVGAFLRQDKKTLDLYRLADLGKGKDEYTIFGEAMNFPKDISRQLSKVIILAACYGMGSTALRSNCINAGLPDMGDAKAKHLLASYHNMNPSVKKAWYDLIAKFKLAIISGNSQYNSLDFKRFMIKDKKFIGVYLPSGRWKYYAGCSVSNDRVFYNDIRLGKIELRPYLLYENLVQASATDVLFLKAAKVNEIKNTKIELTIYDELIVSTLPKNVKAIKEIMGKEEEAFEGMPISFKGVESKTFWKGDRV